jgi:hypothetical protein
MSYYQIHQILPCPVEMVACFLDDEEDVVRTPVHFLAVIRPVSPEPEESEGDFIRPMIGDRAGDFFDPCGDDDFLGIEYNGDRQDFSEEIRAITTKRDSPRIRGNA